MSLITHDYRCPECGWQDIKMHKRDAVPETIPCEVCEASANKIISANITRASYPDGYDRWKNVKELRKLNKLERAAKKAGNHDERQRIQNEKRILGDASRRDKKSCDIVKVKE